MDERKLAATVIVSTNGCARCWGDGHKDLVFERLTHPFMSNDEVEFSHWASCPTNGEPILMAIYDDPKIHTE